ncbi:MAG TPA: hypothetical protein VL240_06000 [Candidatus Binatia bacterium]|nr:hypothetical protein [Candidatus Binatia bacterium]
MVCLLALVAVAILNNNYSLGEPSRAAFSAQLDHAIETSTQWILTHPEVQGNPPLMYMVADMAEMSGDPRLHQFVESYLGSSRVNIPGRPITFYWARWADPRLPVPEIPKFMLPELGWQNRWFAYASAPNKVKITEQDHANLFSPTKYSWGIRVHFQLLALDMYRRFNGTSAELDGAINPVAEAVAHSDAYWDFRVGDAYYQRSAVLLAANRPDLVRSRWIDRILDHQHPDGSWNYCWYGWCRGVLEFRLKDQDFGHSTVQAAWALYMLKYRYSDWIAQHYH